MYINSCVSNGIFPLYVFAMWILNSMMILAPAHVFTSTAWTFWLSMVRSGDGAKLGLHFIVGRSQTEVGG